MLCSLALLGVVELHNVLNIDMEGKFPLEKLSGVQSDVGIKHFHTWGCPVYVLGSILQAVKLKLPKWDPSNQSGIYIEHFNTWKLTILKDKFYPQFISRILH